MLYGRDLLLHGEKRNAVLDLPEIHRFGMDSYGDANYVSIYGLRPARWHSRGIRLLGRTRLCVEEPVGEVGRRFGYHSEFAVSRVRRELPSRYRGGHRNARLRDTDRLLQSELGSMRSVRRPTSFASVARGTPRPARRRPPSLPSRPRR